MRPIGELPMPQGFRYREIFLKGRPQHDRTDPFRSRHPSMDVGRRARIFAPFDALKGLREAIAAREGGPEEGCGQENGPRCEDSRSPETEAFMTEIEGDGGFPYSSIP